MRIRQEEGQSQLGLSLVVEAVLQNLEEEADLRLWEVEEDQHQEGAEALTQVVVAGRQYAVAEEVH